MRNRSQSRTFAASVAVLSAGIAGVLAAVTYLGVVGGDGPHDAAAQQGAAGQGAPAQGAPSQTPAGPRRMPVVGLEGYFVTVNPDGSSFMESPGGRVVPLADAGGLPGEEDARVRKTLERVAVASPRRTEVGQIVVLESGVIDVPADAVITLVGKDRLVTHEADGSSVVYHVSGRVERRGRSGRVRDETP